MNKQSRANRQPLSSTTAPEEGNDVKHHLCRVCPTRIFTHSSEDPRRHPRSGTHAWVSSVPTPKHLRHRCDEVQHIRIRFECRHFRRKRTRQSHPSLGPLPRTRPRGKATTTTMEPARELPGTPPSWHPKPHHSPPKHANATYQEGKQALPTQPLSPHHNMRPDGSQNHRHGRPVKGHQSTRGKI